MLFIMDTIDSVNLKNQRSVLVLNLTNECYKWDEHFNDLNWHGIFCVSVNQAINQLTTQDINVAIVVISSEYQQIVFEALTRIMEVKKSIIWIALSSDNKFLEYQMVKECPSYFFDYHHLPIDWEKLGHTLGHALGMVSLKSMEVQHRVEYLEKGNEIYFGSSSAIRSLASALKKVAAVDATVLISGETGTGKGLYAQWLHENSARKEGPFISVNCAALPTSLIHSELFGYEKGAFTGATKKHLGHIERAEKGSIFIDEIGDLSLESQINLLRFLEDNTIERLGGAERVTIDCRIILASHVDLEAAVEKGQFREDLYYRLNILNIHVPTLREHREDIESLALHFLQRYNTPETTWSFSTTAIEVMLQYDWPGNVRELKNRIQRAVVMSNSPCISFQDLGIKTWVHSPEAKLIKNDQKLDTEALLSAIRRNNYNISAAARELKISRPTFYKLVKKCNIKI